MKAEKIFIKKMHFSLTNYPINPLLFLLIIALISILCPRLSHLKTIADGGVGEEKCPLAGKSFSLRSYITIIYTDGSGMMKQVHEFYSVEQQRAKINFKLLTPYNRRQGAAAAVRDIESGTFYLDTKRDDAILFNNWDFICKSSSAEEFVDSVIKFAVPNDGDPTTPGVADDFIVGPARLLFFLSKHRDRMKLTDLFKSIPVRNVPCLMYVLDYQSKYEHVEFSIFYSESALAADPMALPMEVIMRFPDAGATNKQQAVMVDFAQVDYNLATNPTSTSSSSQQVVLDPFIIEPIVGCSKVMFNKEVELFKDHPDKITKFSFKANFNVGSMRYDSNIAYDSTLASLRFDIVTDVAMSGVKKQIFNFKLNRMYHIMERIQDDAPSSVSKILDLGRTQGMYYSGVTIDSTQCMIAKILPQSNVPFTKEPISLGKLIAGADSFVYMGKARVRNIDALVYESYVGSAPYWLEPPVVYKKWRSDEEKLRQSDKGVVPDEAAATTSFQVLLYLAENDDPLDQQVLLIELYEFDNANFGVRSKRSIYVNDFAWRIDHQAFDEPTATDLFSLEDLCSAGLGENEYSSVEFLLEFHQPPGASEFENEHISKLLEQVNERNVALLASFQEELKLPVTMIYDLESKLFKQSSSNNQGTNDNVNKQQFIATTFRVAEHSDSIVDLFYVGQGSIKSGFAQSGTVIRLRSFQACFFMASHRRANIYFGYNHQTRRCAIMFTPIKDGLDKQDIKDSTDNKNKNNSNKNEKPLDIPYFIMNPRDDMEIYRIHHVADSDADHLKASHWIRSMVRHSNKSTLMGSQLLLPFLTNVEAETSIVKVNQVLPFIVRRVEVDERDFKTSLPGGAKITDELPYVPTIKRISGFGLVYNEPGNRRVAPEPLNSYNWSPLSSQFQDESSTMTYDQCHAACLSQENCQSFSTCIIDAEMQCVTSELSFKQPTLIEQLKTLLKTSPYKRGQKVKVSVMKSSGQTILDLELIQHPNCDLYNIAFLDHFAAQPLIVNTLIGRNVFIPVKNEEDCAELCIKNNVKVLREDIGNSASGMNSIFGAEDVEDTEMEQKLSSMLTKHRQSMKRFQRGFFYLDVLRYMSLSPNVKISINERITAAPTLPGREMPHAEEIDGYCVVHKSKLPRDDQHDDINPSTPISAESVDIDMYNVRFDLFYEKQYGVRLRESQFKADEVEAYRRLKTPRDDDKPVAYKVVKSLVEKGDNFQEIIYAEASVCARICFLQTWGGPWPACRSFDVVIDMSSRQEYVSRCYLNSITLRQAVSTQRLDLIMDSDAIQREKIERQKNSHMEVWHYEPRAGFVSGEVVYSGELEKAAEGSFIATIAASLSYDGFRLHGFGSFLIVLISLICGVGLGIKLGLKYVDVGRFFGNDEDDVLVEPQQPINLEFNNIVNFEANQDFSTNDPFF